ncbi:MAG: SDR family NAD(P)-dependent oxidoreductase [Methylovirgula sp.]
MNSQKGTVLITGASAGIGATYADRLAHRGHDLILVARDAQRLETLAAKLRTETKVKVEVLPADLTKKSDMLRIEQRLATDRDIDVFVNNAGILGPTQVVGQDPDALETVIQLNIVAATRLATAAATAFASRRRGSIINLASVVALLPERFGGAYAASKAYLLHFSQSLQQELTGSGVRVQAVMPGATRTEIWERAGIDVASLDPNILMDVGEMVDAALVGLDQGELVTIPSLPEPADWEALNAARYHLGPNLSRNHAAARYQETVTQAA